MFGFNNTPTLDNLGRTALSSSSCFGLRSAAVSDKPMKVPFGRATLPARPSITGSVNFQTQQLLSKAGKTLCLGVREARLDKKVPPFDVAEIAHPLKEGGAPC